MHKTTFYLYVLTLRKLQRDYYEPGLMLLTQRKLQHHIVNQA